MRLAKVIGFLVAVFVCALPAASAAETQSYVIEDINDPDILTYPLPAPVQPQQHAYTVDSKNQQEAITVNSTNIRNLAITIENLGDGVIEKPYLYGPHGWDYRDREKLAAQITQGASANMDKFMRVHEWVLGTNVIREELLNSKTHRYSQFSGCPMRMLNEYGGNQCGEMVLTVHELLRLVPPQGSLYGMYVGLGGDVVGEAVFDGKSHVHSAYKKWIYYQKDNQTVVEHWSDMIHDLDLVRRVIPYSCIDMVSLVRGDGRKDPNVIGTANANHACYNWDFNYNLAPGEKITIQPEMHGRLDRVSAIPRDPSSVYRHWTDYGSAVFTYKPDLTRKLPGSYVIEENNVAYTPRGLAPADPGKPSSIVVQINKYPWAFAGADISVDFLTGGKVYLARNATWDNVTYSAATMTWQELSPTQKEYPASSIEGMMCYWLKFTFDGSGSGIKSLQVASEVTMSPWSMPCLEYGQNLIHFEAANMNGSTAKVTYSYDEACPWRHYEPATSNYGRHIPFRIGGNLYESGPNPSSSFKNGKGEFWRNLHQKLTPQTFQLKIYKVSGADGDGRLVRTLKDDAKDGLFPVGFYTFYWDGKDDQGNVLPPGMYSYVVYQNCRGKGYEAAYGQRMYLFEQLWPTPNEQRETPSKVGPQVPATSGAEQDKAGQR